MYDYAGLPTLVLNEIFGYLSVKQRVKCKSVCGAWKEEVELREQMSDTLVLHLGPYPWNMRWSETNNRGLMKFENSFEVKHLTILKHPLTRSLLKKTKKLAILSFQLSASPEAPNIRPYLDYFKHCEEIEIKNFYLGGTLPFELPELKVLVINDSPGEKLVLNCPSLEVLTLKSKVDEIDFQNAKKLKRLICFGLPARVSLDGKFECLEYFNLFITKGESLNDVLLYLMPKLKRFVLYSRNPQADLEIIRKQQKRCGLKNLEILCSGFRDPVKIALSHDVTGFVMVDRCVGQLFDNYSKLVENSPWPVWIDYSQLFSKFKILPSNFIERFSEPFVIEISAVTNYTHLFGFLKCYPFVQDLRIHFSKVEADLILDLAHLLQPSLTELTILEERPSDVLQIDLSFLSRFNLTFLNLVSTRIPVEFIRKVAAKRGPHLNLIMFDEIVSGHRMVIHFDSQGYFLVDDSCGSQTPPFSSIEQLISHVQSDRHLRTFLLM